ncbi:MAG: hypothetical protein RPU39_13460 [Candidatus Sedimenticola sp. (ex Thyasira tokunagai)]
MFSEDGYYTRFKAIRNKFRKFRYFELVAGCFEYLHAPAASKLDFLKRNPWLVLLFAKWLLLDDNYPNRGGKIASKDELMGLLQSVHDLADKLRMPNEYDHYTLFFRNIAYQQFPYQFDFGYRHLSRQSILFADLPDNHLIKTQFKELTGVSIQDFLDLSWVLLVRFIPGTETRLSSGWFDGLKGEYSPETIDNYLKAISVQIDEGRGLLRQADDRRRRSTEHYEFTPFLSFPLIQIPDGYLITENHVLYRCIEHYVYDRLRQWDAERFMDKFGGMFEHYAERALAYAGLAYTPESQTRAVLGERGNQIDFIVHEDASNVFIDTKGVEMNYQGRVTHSAAFLKDKTKPSVLKAITQAHDVIRKLEENPGCGISSRDNNYLLVVTYKDFYLGSGRSYYEIVAQKAMDQIYQKYDGLPVIPPENMYFITIDDLDFACAMTKDSGVSLSSMIDAAKDADEKPDTRKFDFVQHLHGMPVDVDTPKYLKDEKDKIFDKLERLLRP